MSPVTGKRRLDARQMPTPTAAPERTASRPNMGPLTTDFKAPDHCTRVALACPTCTNAFLGRSCKADATGTIAPTPEDDAACWPTATAWPRSGHQPFAGFGIYSPAVQCPTGYTSACGAIQTKASNNDFKFQFPLEAGEEAIGCCPQGYECAMHEAFGWQTCRQVVTSTQIEAFECGAGGSSKAVEAFAIPFTRDAVTFATMDLWAPMLQIVHQPTDVPQSVASKAESSSISSPTSIAAKPAKDHKKQSGLTTGEAIGIAISPAIIALIAVLVFFFFWKKRRNAPPAQPQQPRDLDAAAAVPPPPIPGAAARNLASSKDSFRSNDTDSTKVPSVKGSPTPDGKPSPAPTHTPIYDEQVKLRRETVDPFFLADHERPPKTPDSSYFDAWQGSDPVPPVPPLRGVYDYEKGQYSNADPEPMYMPPQPIQATPPMSQNPYTYERTHFPNSPEPAAFPNTPGNEPGPTIRNNDVNPYEGYGYGDGYGDSDYPLSPEMFPAAPGMRNEQTTRGYDSPIDSSSPFRLKRGDTGDSIRRYSEESDIGNQVPRAVWADDERTPRASHESTWPTMLNKNDSFSRPRPPGSYSPPQRQSPLAFPAPAGSLSPPPPPPPEPKTASWSPETQQHEWKNPMRRADSFSRPRPRNLTPPTSPPMTSQSGDRSIDARIMDPTGMAK